jgi:hypothetical protein
LEREDEEGADAAAAEAEGAANREARAAEASEAGEGQAWARGPHRGIASAPAAARSCHTARESPASNPPAPRAVLR